ncbi:hypothetical protein [Vibrio crassostreae]|uniref:hypothetical protein n=1 Tax=Vibrio crassostreae TaxID=246167 RepID=UPI001B303EEA|nr:hypothetical protein [Vibrio crassostreae]
MAKYLLKAIPSEAQVSDACICNGYAKALEIISEGMVDGMFVGEVKVGGMPASGDPKDERYIDALVLSNHYLFLPLNWFIEVK